MSVLTDSADNVRTNPDGTPREVEWVFEPGKKARVPTYIAYEKRTKPIRPDRKTGLHDRKKALGYMFHRLDERLFVLVNHNTSLSRNVWSMGETSKGNTKHCIGGHGSSDTVKGLIFRRGDEGWDMCITSFGVTSFLLYQS
jgi:hypothetical protein